MPGQKKHSWREANDTKDRRLVIRDFQPNGVVNAQLHDERILEYRQSPSGHIKARYHALEPAAVLQRGKNLVAIVAVPFVSFIRRTIRSANGNDRQRLLYANSADPSFLAECFQCGREFFPRLPAVWRHLGSAQPAPRS